jgi:hypothetical protein
LIKANSNAKELTVKVNNTIVVVKGDIISISDEARPVLPYRGKDVTVKRETDIFISITGKMINGTQVAHTMSHLNLGTCFRIMFDGVRVYVTLEQCFLGNTRGLCGTYDMKSDNEFLMRIDIVETTIQTFVNEFRVNPKCETPAQQDPCDQNPAVSHHESSLPLIKLLVL